MMVNELQASLKPGRTGRYKHACCSALLVKHWHIMLVACHRFTGVGRREGGLFNWASAPSSTAAACD